ncbi:MAG: fused MFS/spermidine synthase [Leptospirillia bacterium]
MRIAGLAFLILSGMAALTYQVTWVRLLGLSMGSTSAAVGTVLAAFFLGMSGGSYLSRYFVSPRFHRLTPYIALEVMIGLSGLALLPILLHLDGVMAGFPLLGKLLVVKFLIAMVLLSIPSICIGATFPVMAGILIERDHNIGRHFGQLYSLNTLGAVLGAGLSGFVLIPAFGLDGATYVAVALNFTIVITGVLLMRDAGVRGGDVETPHASDAQVAAPYQTAAFIVLFFSGFTAIATEVGYTKYVAIFAGTTIYGFAAILTVFLAGITLGSWLIKSMIDRIRQPQVWMAYGLVLLGFSLVLTRSNLNLLPPLSGMLGAMDVSDMAIRWIKYGAIFLILLPPTLLFGALFPLNLRLYCGDVARMRTRVGQGYAINTLGSILGSLFAGFFIIPRFGTDTLLGLMAGVLIVLGLLFLPHMGTPRARFALLGATALALAGFVLLPALKFEKVVATALKVHPDAVVFLKEGKTAVISLSRTPLPRLTLASNGLQESSVNIQNPTRGPAGAVVLGAFPYLFHPDAETAFLIGFGGGITTHVMTTTGLSVIRVVELEPVVIEAVESLHGGKVPAFSDPRVRLDINDARHTLLMEDERYDLIISQPSHPWVAGMANLFTREFYQLAASRLNDGGIFNQWINLYHMDAETLGILVRTFYEVFPHGIVLGDNLGMLSSWVVPGERVESRGDGSLYLLGSNRPIGFDAAGVGRRLAGMTENDAAIGQLWQTPEMLFASYLFSREEALALSRMPDVNTDANLLSEVRLAALEKTPTGDRDPVRGILNRLEFDLVPYLGADTARFLSQFGERFLANDQLKMAERVEMALEEIDPQRGRWLRHARLTAAYDFPQSMPLYQAHQDWPAANRYAQAVAFMDLGRLADAAAVVKDMGDPALGRLALARLLFERGAFARLAAIKPASVAEWRWQLVGMARQKPALAARGLARVAEADPASLEIPQLQTLVQLQRAYPKAVPPAVDAGRLLRARINQEVLSLSGLLEEATRSGNQAHARVLLGRIRQMRKIR